MCGIVGIYNHPEAAKLSYLALYALQHRGQESAGIVSSDGQCLYAHRQMGLVADIFSEEVFKKLPGKAAIGHVRYSTTGSSELINCQPVTVEYARGWMALAHNGNLVNAQSLREEFEENGSIFQSTMDTEAIVHLIASKAREESLIDRIVFALSKIKGAFSLVFLTESRMIAARDPRGFRPLVLGDLNGSPVVVSETCALDLIEAKFVRDILPGEVLVFDKNGMKSFMPFTDVKKAKCIFEHVYFARPDSKLDGLNVYEIRKGFGRELAKDHPVEADMVVPVPDSGVPAALGYSEESGIPFQMGLIRNHYVGRTFIEPEDSIRNFGVKIKLNAITELVKDKKIVLIDDSIVRGTTSRKIIKMLRDAGAKEIHFKISSPPTQWPCFYGIDTPDRKQLIAANYSLEEIQRYLTCDSLTYLSQKSLYWFQGGKSSGFCDACFTGKFPVALTDYPNIEQLQFWED